MTNWPERLNRARNYWIGTTRPEGQPHSRPVWGVWLDDTFYFSTGSLAAQNLAVSPAITVHLESGSEVVIIEGVAEPISETALVERVVNLYNQKYHWDVDPTNTLFASATQGLRWTPPTELDDGNMFQDMTSTATVMPLWPPPM